MTAEYDFDTIFQLLEKMEECVNKVNQLNQQLDESFLAIPLAA